MIQNANSAEATMAIAQELAADLTTGDVLCLVGDLGAGKTHFVKGLACGLDCKKEVTSPTFTLVNEYHGGRLPLLHLDLYRIESQEELLELGWDELVESGAVIAVEWPDRYPNLMPENARWIALRHRVGEEGREIEFLDRTPE